MGAENNYNTFATKSHAHEHKRNHKLFTLRRGTISLQSRPDGTAIEGERH